MLHLNDHLNDEKILGIYQKFVVGNVIQRVIDIFNFAWLVPKFWKSVVVFLFIIFKFLLPAVVIFLEPGAEISYHIHICNLCQSLNFLVLFRIIDWFQDILTTFYLYS